MKKPQYEILYSLRLLARDIKRSRFIRFGVRT